MFILNKKTGVVSECSNPDVIKYCKNDSEDYTVSENKKDLIKSSDDKKGDLDKPLEKMKVEELKTFALEKDIDVTGLNKEEMLKVIKDSLNGSN